MNDEITNDEAIAKYLATFIEKSQLMVEALDTQINILIGIALAAFAFTSSQFLETHNVGYLVASIFAALSAVASLVAVHPPKFFRKKVKGYGQKKSSLFAASIAEYPSSTEYAVELIKAVKSRTIIMEQCAIDIYNISTYYYLPKRKLFRLSRNLFLIGVIVSLVSVFIAL